MKSKQIVIPEPLQSDILIQLYHDHQGIDATRRLARESIYCPGFIKDLETLCRNCAKYQELQQYSPKESATMHENPNAPWVKLGTDLSEINHNNCLIISDYFSRYPVIRLLK